MTISPCSKRSCAHQIPALLAAAVGLASICPGWRTGYAATIEKADADSVLSDGGAWVGNAIPQDSDVALFGDSLLTLHDFSLGSDTMWGAIVVTQPSSGALNITDSISSLTLNAATVNGVAGVGIDLSQATVPLNINAFVSLGAAQVWNVGTSSGLTISGPIGGTYGIKKEGAGTLTLGGPVASIYLGLTTINRGELLLDFAAPGTIAANLVPSTGTLVLAGSGLQMTGTGSQKFSSLILNTGSSHLKLEGGTLTLSSVTKNGDTLSSQQAATLQIDTNAGNGTVLWSQISSLLICDNGNNAYATYGMDDFAATNAQRAVIAASYINYNTNQTTGGANLGNANVTGNFTLGSSTPMSLAARFADPNTAYTISLTGNTIIRGILVASTSVGGTLDGPAAAIRPAVIATGSTKVGMLNIIQNSTHAPFTINAQIVNATSSTPVSLVKSGPGLLVLTHTNNLYTGQTFINDGVLSVATNGALGAQANAGIVNLNGGTLQFSASFSLCNSATGTNNRAVVLGNAGGTLDTAEGTVGSIPGVISGSGGLTKSNAGTLVLTGANTYAGGTTVSGGTLVFSNTAGSATGPGAVFVHQGLLTGNGSIAGSVNIGNGGTVAGTGVFNGVITVEATGLLMGSVAGNGGIAINSGGHYAPGITEIDQGIGALTATSLSLNAGAIGEFEISSGSNDVINLAGDLLLNGVSFLNLYQPGTTTQFTTPGTYGLFKVGGNAPLVSVLQSNLHIGNAVAGSTYKWSNAAGLLALTISSQRGTCWKNDAGGSWSDEAQWDNGIPHNAGDIANFTTPLAAPRTITLDGSMAAGTLTLDAGGGVQAAYTIASGSDNSSTLILDVGKGASAGLTVVKGSHSITSPLKLNSPTVVTVTHATDTLELSGIISGEPLVTAGAGTLLVTGTVANAGITIAPGTHAQVGNGGTSGALASPVVNDGNITFNRSDSFVADIAITGNGSLIQAGTGTTTLTGVYTATGPVFVEAGKLVFASTGAARQTLGVMLNVESLTLAPSTVLDVTNHDIMIGNSNLVTVENEILNGFGAGSGEAKITSSPALADGNELLVPFDAAANAITSWDDVPVTQPHTIIAKYTYTADANFDGKVDFNDYTVITGNYGQTSPGMADFSASFLAGDLNLDGRVDFNDYTVVTGLYGAGSSAPLGTLSPLSSAPEPASLLLAGCPVLILFLRRRGGR